MEKRGAYCSCEDHDCPLNPRNHDRGCEPCVRKCLKEGEIPSCFFNAVGSAREAGAYTYRDFAHYVLLQDDKP